MKNQFAAAEPEHHPLRDAVNLIRTVIAEPNLALPEIAMRADRFTLAKRLWRGAAEDGVEFGFDLATPIKHGQTFHESPTSRYVIRQLAEPVVEVSLDITPAAAAGIGWAIGNLHLELSAEPARLLAPDEPAIRQLLERLQVPFQRTTAIFRPGRFARGVHSTHELGASHRH